MGNLLSAIPALIGVLVGVVATGWTDRIRWRRSQEIRWDERRIDTYLEFARTIKKMHMTVLAIVDPPHVHNLAEPIDREIGLEMIAQAEVDRAEAWEAMLLLADQSTARAALRWRNMVKIEAEFVRSRADDVGSVDWVAAVKDVDETRDRFYEAARKSVNVPGVSMISTLAQLLATDSGRRDSEQAEQPARLESD